MFKEMLYSLFKFKIRKIFKATSQTINITMIFIAVNFLAFIFNLFIECGLIMICSLIKIKKCIHLFLMFIKSTNLNYKESLLFSIFFLITTSKIFSSKLQIKNTNH